MVGGLCVSTTTRQRMEIALADRAVDPTPEEIAARTAEVREGWSVNYRRSVVVDFAKASRTCLSDAQKGMWNAIAILRDDVVNDGPPSISRRDGCTGGDSSGS